MFRFFIGLLIGLLAIPLAAYFYIQRGYAPVATAAPPMPFERTLAHMALDARIAREAPSKAAVPPDEPNLLAGAHLYVQHCAVCHGLPNQPKTAIAQGMFPEPPQLLHGKGVTDDPVGETYWKVSNGIRLTGMPAYRQSLSDTQIWQISQVMATADRLPASVTAYLNQPPPAQ